MKRNTGFIPTIMTHNYARCFLWAGRGMPTMLARSDTRRKGLVGKKILFSKIVKGTAGNSSDVNRESNCLAPCPNLAETHLLSMPKRHFSGNGLFRKAQLPRQGQSKYSGQFSALWRAQIKRPDPGSARYAATWAEKLTFFKQYKITVQLLPCCF